MQAEEFVKLRYDSEWFEHVSMTEAKKKHERNIRACNEAVTWHAKEDRPLAILAVHGSGRSGFESCAHELSNSQMLLHDALEQFRDDDGYEVMEVALRDYGLEPCNGCYSTASALCGFPCNCFPFDGMQQLYPMVLKCDVMLLSTGVNQSTMSSRMKVFLDRLVSLDGGFFVNAKQFGPKDSEWRGKCIGMSQKLADADELPYDARMWGRTAAYFIASKDEDNDSETIARDFETALNYIELTAQTLRDGNADYGIFHDKKDWYAGAWSDPHEEMSWDKKWFKGKSEFQERAALVARKAVELAEKFREDPPKFDGGGRGKTRT